MKKVLSFLLAAFLLASSVAAPSFAFAFAEEDTEAPILWLQTFEINITDDKELAESGDTVTFTVAATDNVAIADVVIAIESPSKNTRIIKHLTNIKNTDYYTTSFTVADDTEAGYWNVPQMQVTDTTDHYMYISNLTSFKFGVKGSIFESDITLKDGDVYTYSPLGVEPEITVTHNGAPLSKGTDYTVKYDNNDRVGTATATVKGIGCFGGEHTKEFTIIPQTKFCVKLSNNTYTYNGKAKRPAVTVYDGENIVDASNYTVNYSAGRTKVGKYPITVTMKNNYSGTKTAHIVIKPQGTSITRLSVKNGSATAILKKQAVQTTGYQLQYSTDKNFKSGVKSKIIAKSKTKATVKSLKKGKKYYFRIRTYTKTGGRTYYSKWSKTKNITG